MDTIAEPNTLNEFAQIAADHYIGQANLLAQTFSQGETDDMETMLAQLNSE